MTIKTDKQKNLPIKQWLADERPREKLMLKGKASLLDSELLAILIGSGSNNESAVALARRILGDVNNSLIGLSKLSINDLTSYKGIGEAKAINIIAAMELVNRKREAKVKQQNKIICSADIYEYFQTEFAGTSFEGFWIIMLNIRNEIIKKVKISDGGTSETIVDIKKIFKQAIDSKAKNIILCHNHPSNNIKPSQADINITKKLSEGAKLLDLSIVDHVIFGEDKYYSFADSGII